MKNPQLGRFYLLPKIHKRTSNVPGRPVISNNGTASENISAFLDFHLKKYSSNNTTYFRGQLEIHATFRSNRWYTWNRFHLMFTSILLKNLQKQINFLDVLMSKNENEKNLVTSLFTKPTDTHQYLHATSCHRSVYKKSIPYGQTIRMKSS